MEAAPQSELGMPLKIRCPHCRRVLLAEDKAAGKQKTCPSCNRPLSVPLPRDAIGSAADADSLVRRCPRCKTEVAPNSLYCHKCHTDLATGKRLPLGHRLRLTSWRFRATAVFALALFGLLAGTAIRVYLIRSRPPSATYNPTEPTPIPAVELANQLLAAKDSTERLAAMESLRGIELRAAPAVADALAASLEQPDDPQRRWNRIAAIDLLARNAESHLQVVPAWLKLLERCGNDAGLRDAAWRARAILGDAGVLDELAERWLDNLRRVIFLSRIGELSSTDGLAGADLMEQTARTELKRCADGLRRLARDENNPVFERLTAAYWDSWNWLGQGRGDAFARALFDLAQPPEGSLEFKPQDVHGPRDAMNRVAQRGSPAARAAAGLVLKELMPQYTALCGQVSDILGGLLPDSDALDQQRLTWAIARLRGKLFGSIPPDGPLDVGGAEIAAAQQWLRPGVPPRLHEAYVAPPVLVYRAVMAERQLERDLLMDFQGDWTSAGMALDRWLAADLGCTPRVRELLSPGQRRPELRRVGGGSGHRGGSARRIIPPAG